MTDKQPAKSALNKTGEKAANRVAFDSNTVDNKPKPAPQPTSTTPAKVLIPPPASGFQLRDEVEMLRGGYKNTHGEQVKTQGEQTRGTGAPPKDEKKGDKGAAVEINI